MTRLPDTTADAVVGAVEAVVLSNGTATVDVVAAFLDLPAAKAQEAVFLAEDLGLVRDNAGLLVAASPLARMMLTPVLQQRAALLRIAVEAYEPYVVFRDRVFVNGAAVSTAAQQTRSVLGLSAHREVVKETLVSLGTYCGSLRSTGGGEYDIHFEYDRSLVGKLAESVAELSEADLRIRDWLSEGVRAYVSDADVLQPLGQAYLKVSQGDSRGAIVNAGNAVESYLSALGDDMSVNMATSHGLGAKVAALEAAKKLPKKLLAVGRYLSHVRNAADHGVDPEVGAAWAIRDGSGEDFLRVSVSFLESTLAFHQKRPPSI